MKYAALFPGQGSQKVGMLSELFAHYPVVDEVFAQASDILKTDIKALAQNGPAKELNLTVNTQPVLLTASVAMWRVWRSLDVPPPDVMCGHSLGEYSALVCADAIGFEDALLLVRHRAELMQGAVGDADTGMAAVLGVDADTVNQWCAQCADRDGAAEILEAVNYNSPQQTVVAGHTSAIKRLAEYIKTQVENKRIKCITLPVSVPSHSSLMESAADALAEKLNEVDIKPPSIPVLHNVDAEVHETADAIKEALAQQLKRPVQWTKTSACLGEQGIRVCVEIGPGEVLSGLIKRTDKEIVCHTLQTPDNFDAAAVSLRQTSQ